MTNVLDTKPSTSCGSAISGETAPTATAAAPNTKEIKTRVSLASYPPHPTAPTCQVRHCLLRYKLPHTGRIRPPFHDVDIFRADVSLTSLVCLVYLMLPGGSRMTCVV